MEVQNWFLLALVLVMSIDTGPIITWVKYNCISNIFHSETDEFKMGKTVFKSYFVNYLSSYANEMVKKFYTLIVIKLLICNKLFLL